MSELDHGDSEIREGAESQEAPPAETGGETSEATQDAAVTEAEESGGFREFGRTEIRSEDRGGGEEELAPSNDESQDIGFQDREEAGRMDAPSYDAELDEESAPSPSEEERVGFEDAGREDDFSEGPNKNETSEDRPSEPISEKSAEGGPAGEDAGSGELQESAPFRADADRPAASEPLGQEIDPSAAAEEEESGGYGRWDDSGGLQDEGEPELYEDVPPGDPESQTPQTADTPPEQIPPVEPGLQPSETDGTEDPEELQNGPEISEETREQLNAFEQDNWDHLSQPEREQAVEELRDRIAEDLKLTDKPSIAYYNHEDPGDYRGYAARNNTIYVNRYTMGDAPETADTIAHECRHCWQHERAANPQTEQDHLFQENFDHYSRPELNYDAYYSQLVEQDAREYAGQIRASIAEGESGQGTPFRPDAGEEVNGQTEGSRAPPEGEVPR